MLYFGLMFISWFFMQVSQYTVVRSTKDENNWEYVLYTSQVLFCLCIILNIIVWRSNPGFVEGDPSLKFVTLLDSFEPKSLCPDCQIIKTPRSRHCNLCKRCVDRFDHHCPWVNNCIGKNNFAYFYTFVFLQSTYLILLVAITVKYIQLEFFEDVCKETDDRENSSWYIFRRIFGVFWGLIALTFMLSILFLCYLSTESLCKGETQSERLSRQSY